MKKRVVIVGTVALVLLAVTAFFLYEQAAIADVDALRFSNTQAWDEAIYEERENKTPLVGDAAFSIELPIPPANHSKETKKELTELRKLEDVRTDEQVEQILSELNITPIASPDDPHPLTTELILRVLPEFNAVIVTQKEGFDRVRPSVLDPRLTPAIPIPGHPAYPSGHASQSMLMALILGELNPSRADVYQESAHRIAHNREIAGVHYSSDSSAGQLLAERYFALLMENSEFTALLEKARQEWQ